MLLNQTLSFVVVSMLAVAVLDIWERIAHHLGGPPSTNWAIIGRWLMAVLTRGQVFNPKVAETPPYPRELIIGWIFHYFVGAGYVAVFVILWKALGIVTPTFIDGLVFGMASVLVPWLFFLPVVGGGMMARKTPEPMVTCLSFLVAHSIFGIAIALFIKFFWVVEPLA
jgi:hypothetical protein